MVNLIDYVPSHVRESPQFIQITNTENPEFQQHYRNVKKWLLNLSPNIADSDGIAQYEKWLGLTPLPEDSDDDRRQRIILSLTRQLPYTIVRLHRILANLVGEEKYKLFVHQCILYLDIEVDSNSVFDSVVETLKKIVPMNVRINVSRIYNKYNRFRFASVSKADSEFIILPRLVKQSSRKADLSFSSIPFININFNILPRQTKEITTQQLNPIYSGAFIEMICKLFPKTGKNLVNHSLNTISIGSFINEEIVINTKRKRK